MKAHVTSGVDCAAQYEHLLRARRVGLMTNPTGIDHDLNSTIDILYGRFGLSALFACEHGVRGDRQAGEEADSYRDPQTGVTVHSVYGKSQRLSPEMLDAFDILVYDIQDVGARFYTYLYSLSYAMEECAKAGKPLLVLDRINPIGGLKFGGTILDPRFSSFVGDYGLPTRTGLTCGEYARYVRGCLKLDLDLTVIPLNGWKRAMYLDDTDLPWVAPSPNCPHLSSALAYVGTCIFEGTNISEGRGTTLPFEVIGAPWIDAAKLEKSMNQLGLPGVRFRRTAFRPNFSKHTGELCHGVQLHIRDREAADPFIASLLLMERIREMHPDRFEYTSWDGGKTFWLDKLLGTDALRRGEMGARQLADHHLPGLEAFRKEVGPCLLYD